MPWRKALAREMCPPMNTLLSSVPDDIASTATEIRLFEGRRPIICRPGGEYALSDACVDRQMLSRLAAHICGYSLYSREEELKNGYLSINGGFRAGLFGCGYSGSIRDIYGMCIRIPRQIKGCAGGIYAKHFVSGIKNTIIISKPGMGKTTFLRDLVRLISDSGAYVGLLDERGEISGNADVGKRTMVMRGYEKPQALTMLIRSCSPNVIACDEIGGKGDALAILDGAKSGVRVIATAHGDSLSDVKNRYGVKELFDAGVFELYVHLGKRPGYVEDVGCV